MPPGGDAGSACGNQRVWPGHRRPRLSRRGQGGLSSVLRLLMWVVAPRPNRSHPPGLLRAVVLGAVRAWKLSAPGSVGLVPSLVGG